MNLRHRWNFHDFLVKSMDEMVVKQPLTDIEKMDCAVIIGTNREDYLKNMISILKNSNPKILIIILAKKNMLKNVNIKENDILVITTEEKYSVDNAGTILDYANNKKIGGFFFRGQNPNELGNINVLEIAEEIYINNNSNLIVYGTDMDGEFYKYNNFKLYMSGMRLYKKMNEYIDEVLEKL